MSTALSTMVNKFSTRYELGADSRDVVETLKNTCFKGPVTDAQMVALLIVADQYGLNPFTKELYAFPDKNNGIVPVVGVDGWARIINNNPAFDGMDFEMSADGMECTCKIYRKDRAHPIGATEYMVECKRGTGPWQSHPRRMLRHKTMIQAARLAFGFAGIYDQDEAERIAGASVANTPTSQAEAARSEGSNDPETLALIEKLKAFAAEHDETALSAAWGALSKQQRKDVGSARWTEIKRLLDVYEAEYAEVVSEANHD